MTRILILVAILFTGCVEKTKYGPCVGLKSE